MLKAESMMNQKGIESLLQTFMLNSVTDVYKPLISLIQKDWLFEDTTNLKKTCLSIERYNFQNTIIPGNYNNALYTKNQPRLQALKGICTFSKYIEFGLINHYNDKCWKQYPQLRPKHQLNKMRTRNAGSKKPIVISLVTAPMPTPLAIAPAPISTPGNLTN